MATLEAQVVVPPTWLKYQRPDGGDAHLALVWRKDQRNARWPSAQVPTLHLLHGLAARNSVCGHVHIDEPGLAYAQNVIALRGAPCFKCFRQFGTPVPGNASIWKRLEAAGHGTYGTW